MNQNNYKNVKFAIKQNNLELLKLFLTKGGLSDKQLSKCLILAKDKTDICQELEKLIVDSSEENSEENTKEDSEENTKENTKEDNKKEESKETNDDKLKRIHELCRTICEKHNKYSFTKLHILVQYYLEKKFEEGQISFKDIYETEELWTVENVDGFEHNLVHYLLDGDSDEIHKFLEKAVSIGERQIKLMDFNLKNALSKNNIAAFKIIWKKNKNKYEKIFSQTILDRIWNDSPNIHEVDKIHLICYLIENDYDIKEEKQNFLDNILKKMSEEGYYIQMFALVNHRDYNPNQDNFAITWWENLHSKCYFQTIEYLIMSKKFIYTKEMYDEDVNKKLLGSFVKYCPQNIRFCITCRKEINK